MVTKLFLLSVLLGMGGWAQTILGTTPIVADVAAQVAGPAFRVEALIPRGVDPHAFEPTPRDVQRLLEAALIFQNGAGLEAGLSPFLALPEVREKVVDLSQGLPLLTVHGHAEDDHDEHDHHDHERDPHVWWDPTLVARWVVRIQEVLSARFPALAGEFAARASRYLEELTALDAWIQEEAAQIPEERRLLVTDHFVLGYFARRYGFTVVGALIPSHETLAEPSPKELAALEEKIRVLGIPAIFTSHETPLARRVAQDTGAQLMLLPAETLVEGGGYVEMMREAVRRIVEALRP